MVSLKVILEQLGICDDEFWKYIESRIIRYPLGALEFPWGCFMIEDTNGILVNIRVLVPKIVDQSTLLVNIHEFAHAYELYGLLGTKYGNDIDKSEQFARSKEKEYIKGKH